MEKIREGIGAKVVSLLCAVVLALGLVPAVALAEDDVTVSDSSTSEETASGDEATTGDEATGDEATGDEAEGFQFSDVTNSECYYYAAVYALYDAGIVTGYADGTTFGTNDDLTRADFAVLLYRLAGSPEVEYADTETGEGETEGDATEGDSSDDSSSDATEGDASDSAGDSTDATEGDATEDDAGDAADDSSSDATEGDASDESTDSELTAQADEETSIDDDATEGDAAEGDTAEGESSDEADEETSATGYSDVAEGKYYTDAVVWATQEGVITGYGDGSFQPKSSITRDEMFTMVARYLNGGTDVTASDSATTLSAYSDAADVESYATEAVAWCVENGIVTGTAESTLCPLDNVSRAQAVTVLYRAFFAEDAEGDSAEGDSTEGDATEGDTGDSSDSDNAGDTTEGDTSDTTGDAAESDTGDASDTSDATEGDASDATTGDTTLA